MMMRGSWRKLNLCVGGRSSCDKSQGDGVRRGYTRPRLSITNTVICSMTDGGQGEASGGHEPDYGGLPAGCFLAGAPVVSELLSGLTLSTTTNTFPALIHTTSPHSNPRKQIKRCDSSSRLCCLQGRRVIYIVGR